MSDKPELLWERDGEYLVEPDLAEGALFPPSEAREIARLIIEAADWIDEHSPG